MKTTLVFACLVAVALSRHVKRSVPDFDSYICPNEGEHIGYVSHCFFDPCTILPEDEPPCTNNQDAYCRSDACSNPTCDLMFFVGNEYFNCTLAIDEAAEA